MSQWKSDDSSANSPIWVGSTVNLAPNTGNQGDMFGNSTADAFVTGETIGVFGVDDSEVQYNQWELLGVSVANTGNGVLLTANSTTGLQVNGGTASVNAVINVVSLSVATVGVNAAGEGYSTGDTVEITGSGTGSHARATVTANATGNVTAVALVTGYVGDYTVFPNTTANTANVDGAGTGLIIDITPGVGRLSLANNGTFTAIPSEDNNEVTAQAGQTGTDVYLNLKFRRTTTPATSGWNLVRKGSGNRAGRVQAETLVAVSGMTGDAEDTQFPNT